MMKTTDELFSQAANQWDLENLYTDLASTKGKNLTPIEKLHLRGLLCGYSPAEIAEKRQKSARGLEVDLCKTLYQYVKTLVERENEKVENWRNICQWLDDAGYKSGAIQSQLSNPMPVDAKVHIENINIENNKIKIDFAINIQLIVPLSSGSSSKEPAPQ